MAIILSVECAAGSTSVALHRGGLLLADAVAEGFRTASAELMPLTDALMKNAGIRPAQLAAVAVSAGPGSYTGLRIGVATAKGIGYALAVPLLAINTLEILARTFLAAHHPAPGALLCPMLDARRMEVYSALYNANLNEVLPTGARIITPDSFGDALANGPVYFFGDGAAKCRPLLQHNHAHFVAGIAPHARHMGEPAFQKWQQRQFQPLNVFEPLYLKDFIAKKPKPLF